MFGCQSVGIPLAPIGLLLTLMEKLSASKFIADCARPASRFELRLDTDVALKGETGRPRSVFSIAVEYDPSIIYDARFLAFALLAFRVLDSVVLAERSATDLPSNAGSISYLSVFLSGSPESISMLKSLLCFTRCVSVLPRSPFSSSMDSWFTCLDERVRSSVAIDRGFFLVRT